MNIEEAYRFLSLTSDSTENERYAKYEEIRNKLESKLAKAPWWLGLSASLKSTPHALA